MSKANSLWPHYVNKVKTICLHKHIASSYLDLACCISQELCKMLFDQVQIEIHTVKPKNRHLVSPFHQRSMSLSCEQVNIFWHALRSYCSSNVFPAPLQLFHELPYHFFAPGKVLSSGMY